jgi:hypothetical protein
MTNQTDKLIRSVLSDYLTDSDIKKIMPLIKTSVDQYIKS